MSKSVLISIQPKWCELIASGKKTLEVRKIQPKIETPFKCYIYCTKGETLLKAIVGGLHIDRTYRKDENLYWYEIANGKVVGEFICDEIERVDIPYPAYQNELDKRYIEQSCVSYYDLHRYFGHDDGYFWHISNFKIYDEPKELSEFNTGCKGCKDKDTYHCKFYCNGKRPITKPPQSWCYVKELE